MKATLVIVKVNFPATSRLSSALFILPLYLLDSNLRALTCVAKNAKGEINLKGRLPLTRNFHARKHVYFKGVNKMEAK